MRSRLHLATAVCVTAAAVTASTVAVQTHNGPPFPVIVDRTAGPYQISIWADPDATDDGSSAGQFWVVIQPTDGSVRIPSETRATVSISPLDRDGATQTGRTGLVADDVTQQFVALLMDHEGPYEVRASIEGPLGQVMVDTRVEATYDLRPPPILIGLYVLPFVLVGVLWIKLLLRRRNRGRA